MVTIVDFVKRQDKEGKEFHSLILNGGIEMVKSKNTGRYYATTRKCSITSTFNEVMCKSFLGTVLEGKIVKVPCEPYEYALPSRGEVINLDFRWEYVPEEVAVKAKPMEEVIFEPSLVREI
jgi:hypothetical protein